MTLKLLKLQHTLPLGGGADPNTRHGKYFRKTRPTMP